ncbi:hypothetical protein AB0C10_02930 [Microbispora amethystogenes]|uniref:hypothetical protein n=1 Tax=Microbispora amethystogenes TaxID=1427754 RepID=UPI0033F06ECC
MRIGRKIALPIAVTAGIASLLLPTGGAAIASASAGAQALRGGSKTYTLTHIDARNSITDNWRSTRNNRAGGRAQACVRASGYRFDPWFEKPHRFNQGWFFSLRKPNSDRIWASKDYKSGVRSVCSPWVNRRGTFYTRVTVHSGSFLQKAQVWQYWN